MSMKSSTRQVDGVTIIDLSGRITLGEGSSVLRDLVRQTVAKGNKKILLNLGDVTYIDSSGIGELVSAFTSVRNAGGELKLLNLTKKVHDLLQITKLYTVFDVKDDESDRHSGVLQVSLRWFGTVFHWHLQLLRERGGPQSALHRQPLSTQAEGETELSSASARRREILQHVGISGNRFENRRNRLDLGQLTVLSHFLHSFQFRVQT